MTRTEAKWAERVREWRASGETAERFAEGRQFEASTLRYWASRLKLSAQSPVETAPPAPPAPKPTLAMARVVRPRRKSRPAARAAASAELAISVGTARITVGRGFDAELLREVITALGGPR
jgi:hypothetical protein